MVKIRVDSGTRSFWQKLAVIGGVFLVIEGIVSILFSQDARLISNVGRSIRIIIGLVTIAVDSWFLIRT